MSPNSSPENITGWHKRAVTLATLSKQEVKKFFTRRMTASQSCRPWRRQMDSSDPDPHLIHSYLGPHESAPKRHLDRFSDFCRAHKRDR